MIVLVCIRTEVTLLHLHICYGISYACQTKSWECDSAGTNFWKSLAKLLGALSHSQLVRVSATTFDVGFDCASCFFHGALGYDRFDVFLHRFASLVWRSNVCTFAQRDETRC